MTEYLDRLTAHLEIELKRYYPDLTSLNVDFADGELLLTFTCDPDKAIPLTLHQINAHESDADWFVFTTDLGFPLTLPLYIEED